MPAHPLRPARPSFTRVAALRVCGGPAGALPVLSLAQRQSTLRMFAADQEVLDLPRAAVPAGLAWALEDLRVAGGG